ncbi:hypothetical protein B0H17DRAFT_1125651 [Mycena rosella]|uniref:Uncharacterized protein n=1 Tax=Mycena rosella TaxID=1033263 RepID=A0AAD7GWP5_MYCRO|nr:hypothetical protein B0H17DRAFT_1125651 [Mycena rosella]
MANSNQIPGQQKAAHKAIEPPPDTPEVQRGVGGQSFAHSHSLVHLRNLESLREKARLKRAERKNSEDLLKASQEQRRQWDAEYRERKFIKKHGTKKFQDHYVPLLNEFNKFDSTGVHIPGLADSEGEERHSENTEDKSCCDSDDD